MTETATFGSRLGDAIATLGPLCVGIDPHSYLLLEWGLPDSAAGAREFSLRVLEAAAGRVGFVKPQVAFFERFGSAGYVVLEELFAEARMRGTLVIADVKRGDIGSSVDAYGDAWLRPGSPLEADAMTVSAFQGFDSLAGPLRHVENNGKGLFVLAATSNPEARELQTAWMRRGVSAVDANLSDADLSDAGVSVAASIVADADAWNVAHASVIDSRGVGSVGVVLGATLNLSDFGIDTAQTREPLLPVLAPGFGSQGAQLSDASAIFGALTPATLVSESRSVLSSGSGGIVDAIRQRAEQISREVGSR